MRHLVWDVVPAWMPGLVLFVMFPVAVYAPNSDEFRDTAFITALFVGLAVTWAALTATLAFLPPSLMKTSVKILFLVGCLLLLGDLVAPLQVGAIHTGAELKWIAEPQIFNVLQAGLVLSFFLAIVFVPWTASVQKFATVVVMILLVAQASTLIPNIVGYFSGYLTSIAASAEPAKTGNIYHVVFDTYGPDFDRHAAEAGLTDQFDGFVHFKEAKANSDYTVMSVPSFMTGILPGHDPEGFVVWREKWLGDAGLFGQFRAAGYRTWEYHTTWHSPNADHLVTQDDVAAEIGGDRGGIHFAEMVLLRAAPNFLKQEVFPNGRGVITTALANARAARAAGGNYKYPDQAHKLLHGSYTRGPAAIKLMERMVTDEANRPDTGQYVFGHVLMPHAPYNVDRDGEIRGINTSWTEQSIASVRLMANLIQALKDQGKYQTATIIFQGDHGLEKSDAEFTDTGIPEGFYKSPNTLLVVKPAGASGSPLQISDLPAQLIDVAPTALGVIGADVSKLDGHPLFARDFPVDRDVNFMTFGRAIKSTFEMQHFVLHADQEWSERPNVFPLETVWK